MLSMLPRRAPLENTLSKDGDSYIIRVTRRYLGKWISVCLVISSLRMLLPLCHNSVHQCTLDLTAQNFGCQGAGNPSPESVATVA